MNPVDAEMVTNGVLLHRRLAGELSRAGLHRVQITFDGAESIHDTIRVTRNGRGTYAKILRNVAQAAEETDLSWHFRVNISHHNLDGSEKLIDDLGDVVPGERASLHLALIDDSGLGYENEVGYAPEYVHRFKELHTQAIAYGMHVPLSKPMTDCPYCSTVGGAEGAVVNADGQLYSCWGNAGREGRDIGDVVNGYRPTPDIQDKWVACDFEIKSHGTQRPHASSSRKSTRPSSTTPTPGAGAPPRPLRRPDDGRLSTRILPGVRGGQRRKAPGPHALPRVYGPQSPASEASASNSRASCSPTAPPAPRTPSLPAPTRTLVTKEGSPRRISQDDLHRHIAPKARISQGFAQFAHTPGIDHENIPLRGKAPPRSTTRCPVDACRRI
ncbi:hypothetical protein ACF1D2_32110 [Streptomyces bacillaris]|uniref:hypothetical protein n=1 Tax=Streptomyces bacillaris TaxID=68179 RepID=UPI0036FBAE27